MTQQELHKAKGKDLIAFSAVSKYATAQARKQTVQADTAVVLLKDQKIHI
ncbi:MAG: hypothetical protein ACXV8O_11465 [Methylobacter sp.]